jgi:hypothetical protein
VGAISIHARAFAFDVTFSNFLQDGEVHARGMRKCEKHGSHTGVGSRRVPYLYGFTDASCSHILNTNLSTSVLFQLKEHFMITFQARALFVLTLKL